MFERRQLDQQRSGLFRVPREIRAAIYDELVPTRATVSVTRIAGSRALINVTNDGEWQAARNLLGVCQLMRGEFVQDVTTVLKVDYVTIDATNTPIHPCSDDGETILWNDFPSCLQFPILASGQIHITNTLRARHPQAAHCSEFWITVSKNEPGVFDAGVFDESWWMVTEARFYMLASHHQPLSSQLLSKIRQDIGSIAGARFAHLMASIGSTGTYATDAFSDERMTPNLLYQVVKAMSFAINGFTYQNANGELYQHSDRADTHMHLNHLTQGDQVPLLYDPHPAIMPSLQPLRKTLDYNNKQSLLRAIIPFPDRLLD